MPKPIQVTDTNNSFQKASEGEVSFQKKPKKFTCDYTLPPMEFSPCCEIKPIDPRPFLNAYFNRFPVDDEHELNKI